MPRSADEPVMPRSADTAGALAVAGPPLTDAALIAASLSQPERFADVFDRHSAEIYRYAAGRLGPDAADDVTAETFLTAFRKRGHYDSCYESARPWLYGIATRWIREYGRAERRYYAGRMRLPAPEPAALFDEAAADRVAARQMLPVVAEVLASLSAQERDLLLLVAWADLSYSEIAQALRIPPGTVASRLHRTRAKTRRRLGRHSLAWQKGDDHG